MTPETVRTRRWIAVLGMVFVAWGCATAPPADPDSTVLWGRVRLSPKSGSQVSGGGYGDRRLAGAKRVDYSQIQFAIVYVPSARSEASMPAELVIRTSDEGARLAPRYAATSPGAGIRVTNATTSGQIVSVPGAARLEQIAAGESVLISGLPLGESSVHLLGSPEGEEPAPVQVWATEGVIAPVDATGRYTLRGLEPGSHQVRAWHPRLPPAPAHAIELTRGSVLRLDLEIGVDTLHAEAEGAP